MMRHQTDRLLRRQLEQAKDSHLERVNARIASRKRAAETTLSRARVDGALEAEGFVN